MKGSGRGGYRPGAGRPGKDSVTLSIRLQRDIYNELVTISESRGVTRTKVIEDAIVNLLKQ